MLTPLGVLGGLRGVFFANIGGASASTTSRSRSWRTTSADLHADHRLPGHRHPRQRRAGLRAAGHVDGFRLVDGRASYGIGLESFLLGFPMHFDWSWKTLFNRDWEDALLREPYGGSNAVPEGQVRLLDRVRLLNVNRQFEQSRHRPEVPTTVSCRRSRVRVLHRDGAGRCCRTTRIRWVHARRHGHAPHRHRRRDRGHRHTRSLLVTAAVDGLQFLHPIKIGDLIILRARVTADVHTSLEVEVEVFSEGTLTGRAPADERRLSHVRRHRSRRRARRRAAAAARDRRGAAEGRRGRASRRRQAEARERVKAQPTSLRR